MNDIIVFIGPTLSSATARNILDATFLPPAEQGSIVRAIRQQEPRALVLIDGAFGNVPAVRHKEILWALFKGVPVLGAASIGALRAAELAAFGLRGFGFVYRWYALTPLADDDEVAVAMAPPEMGASPLSEALLNMRLTLRRARRAGVLTASEHRALVELARETHFIDRSYARLLSDAALRLPSFSRTTINRLSDWLPQHAVDRKREDAIGLLTALAQDQALLDKRPEKQTFKMTETWAIDLMESGLWRNDIYQP